MRIKTFKKLLVGLAIAATAVSLSACSNLQKDETISVVNAFNKQIDLDFGSNGSITCYFTHDSSSTNIMVCDWGGLRSNTNLELSEPSDGFFVVYIDMGDGRTIPCVMKDPDSRNSVGSCGFEAVRPR